MPDSNVVATNYYPGSIGASSTELSKVILSSEAIIDTAIHELRGQVRKFTADGEITWEYRLDANNLPIQSRYTEVCFIWYESKLREILNKNQFLGDYQDETEMNNEALFIANSFVLELSEHLQEFGVKEPGDYDRLCYSFSNFLAQSVRMARDSGIRSLLQNTHTEQISTVHQTAVEENKGGGGLFGTGLFAPSKTR